jgi:hypothetical protein
MDTGKEKRPSIQRFFGNLWPETEWWIMKKDETQNFTDVNFHKHIFSAFAFHVPFFWFAAILKGILDFCLNHDGKWRWSFILFWGFISTQIEREGEKNLWAVKYKPRDLLSSFMTVHFIRLEKNTVGYSKLSFMVRKVIFFLAALG